MLFDESTVTLLGKLISVANRLLRELALLDRNSATVPEREMKSPTVTASRTESEVVKTMMPFDTRGSSEASPWIQKLSSVWYRNEYIAFDYHNK